MSYYLNKSKEANSLTSLDFSKHNRNSPCGKLTLFGQKPEEQSEEWLHLRMYCKKWSCPICGPKKAHKLKKAITENAAEKKLNRLMTLTLDPSKCDAETSVIYIKECWNKLRTYLKRHYGQSIDFITVLEFQKNGYAHLHVLINHYIDQSWLSKSWQSLGGGKIVDVRFVDVHRIANYLGKYLTKEMFLEHYGKNRRYTTSRGLTLFTKATKGKSGWRVLKVNIDKLLTNKTLLKEAFKVELDNSDNLISFTTNFEITENYFYLHKLILNRRKRRKTRNAA